MGDWTTDLVPSRDRRARMPLTLIRLIVSGCCFHSNSSIKYSASQSSLYKIIFHNVYYSIAVYIEVLFFESFLNVVSLRCVTSLRFRFVPQSWWLCRMRKPRGKKANQNERRRTQKGAFHRLLSYRGHLGVGGSNVPQLSNLGNL